MELNWISDGQGRKRLTTSHTDQIIHRRKSAKEMTAKLKSEYGTTINAPTTRIRKQMHELVYRRCVAR